jgi:hypothetical protein
VIVAPGDCASMIPAVFAQIDRHNSGTYLPGYFNFCVEVSGKFAPEKTGKSVAKKTFCNSGKRS